MRLNQNDKENHEGLRLGIHTWGIPRLQLEREPFHSWQVRVNSSGRVSYSNLAQEDEGRSVYKCSMHAKINASVLTQSHISLFAICIAAQNVNCAHHKQEPQGSTCAQETLNMSFHKRVDRWW